MSVNEITAVEKYPAIVTNVEDPEHRGRFKVACVGILGDEKTEIPIFVEPSILWGWFVIPDIGESVEVEVVTRTPQDEHTGQASIDNLDLRWRGVRFDTDEELETSEEQPTHEPRPIHEELAATYEGDAPDGKIRGFATPKGHILFFQDQDGEERISITWTDGTDEGKTTFLIDNDGSVLITTKGKHSIHVQAGEVIEIKLNEGATLKLESKDDATAMTIGDGAKHVPIVETLEALWEDMVTYLDGHTHLYDKIQVSGGSGAPAVGTPVPTESAAPSQSAEAWDGAINSTKVSLPDG